jgi:hypothetical protein
MFHARQGKDFYDDTCRIHDAPHARPMLRAADARVGARLLRRLPAFLRRPLIPGEARITLRNRLARREADFLALARQLIYGHAGSPYRGLLRMAGCEPGDLDRLVGAEGLEGALGALAARGVYLTVEEFKGRRPVVRGSTRIAPDPGAFANPLCARDVPGRSSGSRGPSTPVLIALDYIRDCAVDTCLALEARGGGNWLKAYWGVPGASATVVVLRLSAFSRPVVRWFSQVDPRTPGLDARYRWSLRGLRWGSGLARRPLPAPEFVSVEDPLPIVRWMAAVLHSGATPFLQTFPTSAVRIAQAALDAGIDLAGARMTMGGEPTTRARLATIRRAGIDALPRYSSIECGPIGHGCLRPDAPDDVHLLHDLHPLVPGPGGDLLVSSLRMSAPLVLLNVSLGDRGTFSRRGCGCPMEGLGWTTHLSGIRSVEKTTAAGMTFLDADLVRVLEEVLPSRFGGGPADYQLAEEEDPNGRPALRLRVHPRVGELDRAAVADAFLSAVGAGSGAERIMGLAWRQARVLRVERQAPILSPTGKILHLRAAGSAD